MSVEYLGEPLTDIYSIPGGQAFLYQRGVTINGPRGEAIVSFAFPMIGRPVIVTGDPTPRPLFEAYAIRFALGIECGPVGPGWLSARWTLEPAPGSPLVRLRNSWKPDQCLHIEGGELQSGAVEPGWLSAMWMIEYEG